MFDRESELKALKERFSSEQAELIVVYGRRGIGKTTLILNAISDLNAVYLFTPRGGLQDVLTHYSRDLREQLGMIINLTSWEDFADLLVELGKRGYIVVIDEFQRLSEAYSPSISLLQDLWDRRLKRTRIKLVLVGSVVGMVERLALREDSPLFGRKTAEFRISLMPYVVVREYWKNYEEEERVKAYGVFGGTPNYFTSANPGLSVEENLISLVLSRGAKLCREPECLLAEETRAPATYMSILSQLSRSGRGLPLSKIHIRRGSPTVYLMTLMKMDLVERMISLAQGDSIYSIKDEFFRFWFYFVYPRESLLEMGKGHLLLEAIREGIDEYLSFTFERILRELIALSAGGD